jgi:predicted nuclease of restriction endonuclease-like (RecB) superfamily
MVRPLCHVRCMGKKPTRVPQGDETKQLDGLVSDVSEIIDTARRQVVRSTNAMMTAAYWCVGRRISEEEQRGVRAEYGEQVLARLADRIGSRFGRAVTWRRLAEMRAFYQAYPDILRTLSAKSDGSIKSSNIPLLIADLATVATAFSLPWSHYVRLMRVRSDVARKFYELEALRGGWTERQLSRQISTQFFERTIRASDRESFLQKGRRPRPDDHMTLAETINEPYLLEFLDLRDEYSENDAEDALVNRIQEFLLELGGDFAFVGRQKRLRVDDKWLRIDLLFFHRRLRCLVIIDLKRGELTAADAGQINLYCNYAREHWMLEVENPPVGLVLCTEKGAALARYAFEGLGSKVLAAEYRTILPSETELAMEVARAHVEIARRQLPEPPDPKPRKPRGGGGGSRAGEAVAPWLAAPMLH